MSRYRSATVAHAPLNNGWNENQASFNCRFKDKWNFENADKTDLQSKAAAEVNADNGHVESLYYDDKAYWDARPAVTAPISLVHGYPHRQMQQP